jgi:L-ascorbate oxidase
MRLRSSIFATVLVLALPLAATAQQDATTGQEEFREPRTIVPSMNGGATNVIRAVHDDIMLPRLVRKTDGSREVVEEMAIAHTWDGQIPGNTYRVMPGEQLDLLVENHLRFEYTIDQLTDMNIIGSSDKPNMQQFIHDSMNITNLHVHGLHLSPQKFQDNVLLYANYGKKIPYSYQLPAIHAPGTHWYHPHHHGSTALQVTLGMVGALIVGEPRGQNLTPVGWPAAERLMVIHAFDKPSASTVAEMPTALRGMLPEKSSEPPAENMQEMIANLAARNPELAKTIADLSRDKQLERLIKAVEDQLNPPTLTVNGQVNPVDEIELGQLVRMRIVNAGSRNLDYRDFWVEGHDIFLAAMDGVNLSSLPRATDGGPSFEGYVAYNTSRKLTLAPGNRADLYFIAGKLGEFALTADLRRRAGGDPEDTQKVVTFKIREPGFRTVQERADAELVSELSRFVKDLDANLQRLQGTPPYATGYLRPVKPAEIATDRTLTFNVDRESGTPFLINGRNYNSDGANPGGHGDHGDMPGLNDFLGNKEGDGGKGPRGQTPWPIRRDTAEKWTIQNVSGGRHPFHIHVNPAFVIGIVENGKPVPATDPRLNRWQDTIDLPPATKVGNVTVPGSVTVLQRFSQFEGLYVLHCHILQHEDRGMMVNVLIMPPDHNDKKAYFDEQRRANDKLNAEINKN